MFQYTDEDRLDLTPFLPPQYSEDRSLLRDWVAQFLPRRGTIHTRDILANINDAIRSDFQYLSRDAMGTQHPSETLNRRSGTCRDFSLLMTEVVRELGLAARFVRGICTTRRSTRRPRRWYATRDCSRARDRSKAATSRSW